MLTALTLVLNTVLHRFASPAQQHAVPQLTPLHSAQWQDFPFLAVCWPYTSLASLLEPLSLFQLVLGIPLLSLLSLSCTRRFWRTGSLGIRGFAGWHTTRLVALMNFTHTHTYVCTNFTFLPPPPLLLFSKMTRNKGLWVLKQHHHILAMKIKLWVEWSTCFLWDISIMVVWGFQQKSEAK